MFAALPGRASTATVVGVIVAYTIAIAVIWRVLFQWPGLDAVVDATTGLIQPTFVAALLIAALVGSVLLAGSVSAEDAGLTTRDLPRALMVLIVVAAAVQLGLVVTALFAGAGLHAGLALHEDPGHVAGTVIAHLFGTAIVEEVVFRGFLLRQLLIRARDRYPDWRSLALAVAAASLLFALIHIPQRMSVGMRGFDLIGSLAVVGLGGVLASYLYLRSGNLGLVIVLHALFNYCPPFVASPVPVQWILCVVVVGVVAWIELEARCDRRVLSLE